MEKEREGRGKKEEEKEKKKEGERRGECAPSSGMHCPCFCGSSHGSRAMYFVQKHRSAILECRSLRTFAVAASFSSFEMHEAMLVQFEPR